jgi:hypothetical protein
MPSFALICSKKPGKDYPEVEVKSRKDKPRKGNTQKGKQQNKLRQVKIQVI